MDNDEVARAAVHLYTFKRHKYHLKHVSAVKVVEAGREEGIYCALYNDTVASKETWMTFF